MGDECRFPISLSQSPTKPPLANVLTEALPHPGWQTEISTKTVLIPWTPESFKAAFLKMLEFPQCPLKERNCCDGLDHSPVRWPARGRPQHTSHRPGINPLWACRRSAACEPSF